MDPSTYLAVSQSRSGSFSKPNRQELCLSDEGRVAKEKRLAGKRPRDESEVY